MNPENRLGIGERAKAVGLTAVLNTDMWIDYIIILGTAGATWFFNKEDKSINSAALAMVIGTIASVARPLWIDNSNGQARVGMSSDTHVEESDTRHMIKYFYDAWKTGQVQLPNARMRHTEGFYLGDDPR